MDEKYASLLRFVILGVAAAAHHYAVTPPTSSSVEESYVMGSEGLVEGQDLDTVSWEGKREDIGGKPSKGVLHEKSITLLQLGLKLCSWSRVSFAFVLSLCSITDILLQHYSMVCGAWLQWKALRGFCPSTRLPSCQRMFCQSSSPHLLP